MRTLASAGPVVEAPGHRRRLLAAGSRRRVADEVVRAGQAGEDHDAQRRVLVREHVGRLEQQLDRALRR